MNSVIVYDSTYGHTEYLAQVISNTLIAYGSSCAVAAAGAPLRLLDGTDLLVVASPTQYRRPTPVIREWIGSLPSELTAGLVSAALDTRYRMSRLKSGSAAAGIAKALKRRGMRMVMPPTSFFVSTAEGDLEEGEAERAREWAKTLAARMQAKRVPRM